MINRRIICLGTLLSYNSFAAGLEQLLTWSGENVGKASAVTSTVEGAESLYFNPAGLHSSGDLANDIVINASYLNTNVRAPTVNANQSVDAKDGHHIVPAVFYSRNLNEKFAYGVGLFPSAGLKIEFGEQAVSPGVTASPVTDLQMIELSAGASYQVMPKLSVGLAYRVSYARADFTTITPNVAGPGAGIAAKFTDLAGSDFFSFRGGVQYKEENWGMGLNVRTPIDIKVKGKSLVTGALGDTPDDSASISTTVPLVVSLGAHCKAIENLTLLIDYSFLNYNANDDLEIDAAGPVPGLGGTIPNKKLAWNNGHVLRLGAEYNLNSYKLRAGYIIANSIVNPDYASPTVEAPGLGQLWTVGAGIPVGESSEINLAGFYGFAKDSVSSSATDNGIKSTVNGKYRISGFAFHTGFGMKF